MDANLKAFYKAYAAWLADGAHYDGIFRRDRGLCSALHRWVWVTYPGDQTSEVMTNAAMAMKQQFMAAGLSRILPFDVYPYDYGTEVDNSTCHLNPHRIKWVHDHAI